MKSKEFNLDADDVAKLFHVQKLSDISKEILDNTELLYRELLQNERDKIFLNTFLRIDSNIFPTIGIDRLHRWEQCWQKNLEAFLANKNPAVLVPDYYKSEIEPIRLQGDFVMPLVHRFELTCRLAFAQTLFEIYLQDVDSIYEFGCGSGINLAQLGEIYPRKCFYGLDWAESSVQLIEKIGQCRGLGMQGKIFDMFHPDSDMLLESNAGILTFHALEQLGDKFMPFLEFLLEKKPEVVIFVEPLYELYDDSLFTDYLAMRFHRARNYLLGLVPYLQTLQTEGIITIDALQRVSFGGTYHEAYSYVIWHLVK